MKKGCKKCGSNATALSSTADLDMRDRHGLKPRSLDSNCGEHKAPELVNHPAHYNHGKFETIDVIEDWELDFNCGNTIKYISRHMHKNTPVKDIEKAIWYLERRLELLKKEN
jgi:hypothetical protein